MHIIYSLEVKLGLKGMSIRQGGEVIKVVLMDTNYEVYFKEKANINKPKEMEELKEKLRHKGVAL